jgi:hypothetical protein
MLPNDFRVNDNLAVTARAGRVLGSIFQLKSTLTKLIDLDLFHNILLIIPQ